MSSPDFRWLLAQATAKLPAGNVLFIEAPELASAVQVERDDITPINFTTRREAWLRADLPDLTGVMLGWSPAKEQVRMQLAMIAEVVPVGTPVWIFGHGRSGITSAPTLLGEYYEKAQKVAYGGHAELWYARLAEARPAQGPAAWEKRIVVEVAGQELVLISLPGVFSHGEVDDGTRLLLEHLPLLPPQARVHDFGCGCGIVTAWLKRRQSELVVSGSDINALAHEAAKATMKANRLTGVVLHVAKGLAPIPGPLDVIVSNPPFHTGQKTDYSIAEELLASARDKLSPGGALYIVGNRFLPYRELMTQAIGPTEVLAETRQFWVLRAVKAAKKARD